MTKLLILDPRESLLIIRKTQLVRRHTYLAACQQWTQADNHIILCLQAPEVARGQWTEQYVVNTLDTLARFIHASYFYICCSLPVAPISAYSEAVDTWRYPHGGMLAYALSQTHYLPATTVFVGTTHNHQLAAAAAGIPYQMASQFFTRTD